MTYRSTHYQLAARTMPCTLNVAGVRCPTGPSMLVHNDMQSLGKGKGTKSADVGAAGCQGCHDALPKLSREDAQFYTMRGTIRTITAFLERGYLAWNVSQERLKKDVDR